MGSIPSVVIMSQDSFYKELAQEELDLAFANEYDFDHPDAIDMPMFAACLSDLKKGRQTNIPVYSFQEHQRLPDKKYLYGASVIITEGILALHDAKLRALYDLKAISIIPSRSCFNHPDVDFRQMRLRSHVGSSNYERRER